MRRDLHRIITVCLTALLGLGIALPSWAETTAVAGGEDPACVTEFTQNDPRLFDFIKTRRAVDFDRYAGLQVRNIRYITLPVFNEQDKHENNWLYRTANRIHILTKHSVIKVRMLVHENDVLVPERIRETERILRQAPYLYDVMILPETVCPDSIDLLVVVRDVWTLQPSASFGRTGGQNSASVGIKESNLLGYGNAINLSYQSDKGRSGMAYGFSSDHLFDGYTRLDVEHFQTDQGPSDTFLLNRPFYAMDTPWSASAYYFQDNVQEEIKSGDLISNVYDHHSEKAEIYGGLLTHLDKSRVHHWRLGITSLRNNYSNQEPEYSAPLPEDRVLVYPWLEFESVQYDYWTTSNLNQLFRNEDINLGTVYSVRFGASSTGLGSTQRDWVAILNWHKTSSFGSHHVFRNQAYALLNYNRDAGQLEHSFWGYGATYDHFVDELNRWHVRLQYDAGVHLSPEEMLTSGGASVPGPGNSNVLRGIHMLGFPNDAQRGDRSALFAVEQRHFYTFHPFHLLRFGSAVFFEAGRVWDSQGIEQQSNKTLYDVGIGLRVNSSKARPNHIVHFNLAFPLNERDLTGTYQWSVFVSESF